jgi:trehalose synthase
MLKTIESERGWTLANYAADSHLAASVRTLQVEASIFARQLADRTIWMVNSSAQGGGVAEMLPRMTALLEELGLQVKWIVMGSDRPEFFRVTKHLHNLIHGEGQPELGPEDREVYEFVSLQNAEELAPQVRPDDIVVIHDPQPLAMGAMLKRQLGVRTLWRCHIGLDEDLSTTRAAWSFLKPWAESYDLAIFSAPEYMPDYLAGRVSIIHPALDPWSHKNRELSPHKLMGILCNAGLQRDRHPVVTPPFPVQARRLRPDGEFAAATNQEEIGLLYRPLVTQVSRWDRLKGWRPLLEGFFRLKQSLEDPTRDRSARHRRQIELARLVLAGPDPASIQDDPEEAEVLADLADAYRSVPAELQQNVAVISLPMASRKENALMVNALQRCSTVVVQNSLREAFGLTATEAMWKGVCVVGTRACGLRQQLRSGIDGILIQDPQDPNEIARRLDDILRDVPKREYMARNGRQRVYRDFLIFKQLCDWLSVLSTCAVAPPRMESFRQVDG